jgi:hypothetical protein
MVDDDEYDRYVREAVAKAKCHIEKTTRLYEEGTPLFTRATLEKLERHIRLGSNSVSIEHLDGTSQVYNLNAQSFNWS